MDRRLPLVRPPASPRIAPVPGHTPPCGREHELATVNAFLQSLGSGPALLILEGAPGIGKTVLWQAATAIAGARGQTVLTARPAEPEADLAYAALGDLVGGISDAVLASLPGLQRQALDVALLRANPQGQPVDPRAVSMAVLLVLRFLASRAPVLVAVDDWQWVDAPSRRLLAFAIRRLINESVGVLLTVRHGEQVEIPSAGPGWPEDGRRHLAIGPLSPASLHRVLVERIDFAFPRPRLLQLHAASRGNPFFALEIARAVVRSATMPAPGEPFPIPDGLSRALVGRLSALPPVARRALAVVAASARPTRDLVLRAAGRMAASKGLNVALQADIAQLEPGGEIRFSHPLMSSLMAAYDGPPERRRLHRRLAELATGPEEQAIHLARGGPTAADLPAIDAGARSAWLRGASDIAAELAERGLALARDVDPADLPQRRLEAAEYHFRAGGDQAAKELLEVVIAEAPPGSLRARAQWQLGWVARHSSGLAAAVAAFAGALNDAEAAPNDVHLKATIERDLALALVNSGRVPEGHPHAMAALRLADAAGDSRLQNDAIGPLVMTDFLLGRGLRLDLVARARDDLRSDHLPVAHRTNVLIALAQKWSDEFALARLRLETEYRAALGRGAEVDLPSLLWSLSELECWTGNWTLAAAYARSGVEVATLSGGPAERALTLCARAMVAACRGEVDLAYSDAGAALAAAEESGLKPAELWSRHALGFLELSRGAVAAAHHWMAPLAEEIAAMGAGEPGSVRYLPDEIEALIGVGEVGHASALLETFEERAITLNRKWALATGARCRGLVLATRNQLDAALAALDTAMGHHSDLGMPLELGRTMLQRGRIHRRRREKRLAKESMEAALVLFEGLRARLWADTARADLERIGLRPPASHQLTGSEAAVARLAAEGRTNREIASALFLSPKSVDGVMLRVYNKLGIRSRAELGSWMAAHKEQ